MFSLQGVSKMNDTVVVSGIVFAA